MPKVSVVIPSYNHGLFIAEAVESVLAQTEEDLELLVVDDGSTDNSLDVLSSFNDHRLRVFPQSNQGAHIALNRGLELATGKYLAILNSDDVYFPTRLEKCLSVLEENPETGFVGSYIEIINSDGKKLGIKHGYKDCEPWLLPHPEKSFRVSNELRAVLLTENYWSTTSNYVFSRDHYEQVGGFRALRYAHDWDFALRMSYVTQMIMLPEALVRYRVHDSNTIRENQAAMIFEICWILAVHLPHNMNQKQFLEHSSIKKRTEQALYSIYTFEMDRVLNVMLIHQLHQNSEMALTLLEQDDPVRVTYIQYIMNQLDQQHAASTSNNINTQQSDKQENIFFRYLRRARSLMDRENS
jgi:glycosyltransferase involved in cell wall biosynthesis